MPLMIMPFEFLHKTSACFLKYAVLLLEICLALSTDRILFLKQKNNQNII